jgi:hypothetical protein
MEDTDRPSRESFPPPLRIVDSPVRRYLRRREQISKFDCFVFGLLQTMLKCVENDMLLDDKGLVAAIKLKTRMGKMKTKSLIFIFLFCPIFIQTTCKAGLLGYCLKLKETHLLGPE